MGGDRRGGRGGGGEDERVGERSSTLICFVFKSEDQKLELWVMQGWQGCGRGMGPDYLLAGVQANLGGRGIVP